MTSPRVVASILFASALVAVAPPASVQQKLDLLARNSQRPTPDPKPVTFTQDELNAYFVSGDLKMPAGVSGLKVNLHPQQVIGTARVDFDEVRTSRNSDNPFYSLFTGTHDVRVDAFAEGKDGQATIRVREVDLDDVPVPKFALDLFVKKYIQPKYPNVGTTTTFPMPARVDSATVADATATLTQK